MAEKQEDISDQGFIDGVADMYSSAEQAEEPRVKGKVANLVLIAIAFVVLFGYLYLGGEADELAQAVQTMNWWWLFIALCMVVLYWVLESTCMQIFANRMSPGFSFKRTNIVTVIGQYFNCITPLSSGGQPLQAYYYERLGMPYSKSMPMLLCRFISYQLAVIVFCAIIFLFRFSYFTEKYAALMVLVSIGFVGGLGLMTALLLVAFWRTGILKFARWALRLGARIHLVKDYEETLTSVTNTINDSYNEVRFLVHEPIMLFKAFGITMIQLLEYFSISFVIFCGFGLEGADYISVVSCQAFVYLISSFVPTPGAMGAAEGSYAVFFSGIYPNGTYVALSTFIWRLLTFYFPIVVGMIATMVVNHSKKLNAEDAQRKAAAASERAKRKEQAVRAAAVRRAQIMASGKKQTAKPAASQAPVAGSAQGKDATPSACANAKAQDDQG